MKRLFSFVALLMVSVMVVPHADARKFGGGKSFGKSFKTAPASKTSSNTSTLNKKDTTANPTTSNRRGLMGGLLGGLLVGGLFASLLGGGAFQGIQFMDILILGGIAFVIFRLMRGTLAAKQASMNQRQAYEGGYRDTGAVHTQQFEQSHNMGGFGTHAQSEVPHNYPPGFDQAEFVNGAREHYRIIQGAWNYNQLDKIREYVSQSLFDDLKAERDKLQGEQHTDVMYVDAEIVRCDYDASTAQLSLQFSGRYRDAVENIEENIEDIWHLERDLTVANAPWLIVGIQNA